jgi:hypothetical protein
MPNALLDVQPKILATALKTLRESAVMPYLVNTDYSNDAKQKGATVDIPVPSKMTIQDVVPGAYAQNPSDDVQLNTISLPLNNWKESSFVLSNKEIAEIIDGVPNMQVAEAGKAIANAIDKSLIDCYKQAYHYVGTAGTTPFASSPAEAIAARAILGKNLADPRDRRLVIGVDAESNAIALPAFQYYLNSGSTETQREGAIGRKFGFDWEVDQNMPYHVAGTLAGTLVTAGAPVVTTTADASNPQLHNPRTTNTITISGCTNGTTIKQGDVFTVVGDTQTYVINNDATAAGGTITANFSPAPKVVWATGAAVTMRGSRNINLAFHRDAIAFAMRPLEDSVLTSGLGGHTTMTMVDDVTGIPLRLRIGSEYERVRISVSALWGRVVVRPEHLIQMAG